MAFHSGATLRRTASLSRVQASWRRVRNAWTTTDIPAHSLSDPGPARSMMTGQKSGRWGATAGGTSPNRSEKRRTPLQGFLPWWKITGMTGEKCSGSSCRSRQDCR